MATRTVAWFSLLIQRLNDGPASADGHWPSVHWRSDFCARVAPMSELVTFTWPFDEDYRIMRFIVAVCTVVSGCPPSPERLIKLRSEGFWHAVGWPPRPSRQPPVRGMLPAQTKPPTRHRLHAGRSGVLGSLIVEPAEGRTGGPDSLITVGSGAQRASHSIVDHRNARFGRRAGGDLDAEPGAADRILQASMPHHVLTDSICQRPRPYQPDVFTAGRVSGTAKKRSHRD